jgi:hypothetical protein
MSGQKSLCMPRGFVSPQLSFALMSGLMGYLDTVVQSLVLSVFNAWHDSAFGSCVTFEFIRNQHARRATQPLEQLVEEPFCCMPIAPTLHQNIECVPVLANRPPQVMGAFL